ncbi:MAG: hypothetical protein HFJ64_06895 [Eggerthellaceae bacterium]|nr:hypothetical protein [Eggerthellaceae bacterium]
MANESMVSTAEIARIVKAVSDVSSQIGRISGQVDHVDGNVVSVGTKVVDVNDNVKIVNNELSRLTHDFHEYVVKAEMQHQVELATTKLGNAQQQIDAKFRHYGEVRRSVTGILQATDAGIVKKETITDISEEMMVKCKGYWLAPCLVALANWIDDKRDVAEAAIKEGIARDDDKTSLLFGLICRRADRQDAAIKWIGRYLGRQNPESLRRETVVILDAYSSGLFYSEQDDTISKQISEWIIHLEQTPGFLEEETANWKLALEGKKRPWGGHEFIYLKDFSKTWPQMQESMEWALLHQDIMSYFEGILGTASSRGQVKAQLDEMMDNLVASYDDEEVPLMEEIKHCKLIIECDGDLTAADAAFNAEKVAFEERSNFTEILTKAVMYPDDVKASSSTQKLALSLSREWISDAYAQSVAEHRKDIPIEYEINIDTFNDKTKDGSDEDRLVKAFNDHIDLEKKEELEKTKLKPLDLYMGIGGAVAALIGLIMAIVAGVTGGMPLLGIFIIIIGGAMMFRYWGKQKSVKAKRSKIEAEFEEKRTKGISILRAVIAEIVDYIMDLEVADLVGDDVVDLLEQLDPDEYINTISNSNRTVLSI